ncbi:MAG: hypothetical protein ACW99A_02890 [Candidatus Kariarchaeaceae archaeon]|jgi:hypothetical protein
MRLPFHPEYVERVIAGHSLTNYSEPERVKLREWIKTNWYKNRISDYLGLIIWIGLFLFAFIKNTLEGYNFENGVIFGFTLFGILINFLPLISNVESTINRRFQISLENERDILMLHKNEQINTQEVNSNEEPI